MQGTGIETTCLFSLNDESEWTNPPNQKRLSSS